MGKLQAKAKQLIKDMIDRVIRQEMEEWPPKCNGSMLYQPKRPPLPGQPRPQQPTAPPVPSRSATDLPAKAGQQSPVSGT